MLESVLKLFVVAHAGYPFDVLVAIGAPHEKVVGWLARHGTDLSEEDRDLIKMRPTSKGRTVMLTTNQTVIQLLRLGNTPDDLAHLAHEVFHAVDMLMQRIGVTLSPNSDECYAYAIANLTKRILAKK